MPNIEAFLILDWQKCNIKKLEVINLGTLGAFIRGVGVTEPAWRLSAIARIKYVMLIFKI